MAHLIYLNATSSEHYKDSSIPNVMNSPSLLLSIWNMEIDNLTESIQNYYNIAPKSSQPTEEGSHHARLQPHVTSHQYQSMPEYQERPSPHVLERKCSQTTCRYDNSQVLNSEHTCSRIQYRPMKGMPTSTRGSHSKHNNCGHNNA